MLVSVHVKGHGVNKVYIQLIQLWVIGKQMFFL